jgi:hypothetical protein
MNFIIGKMSHMKKNIISKIKMDKINHKHQKIFLFKTKINKTKINKKKLLFISKKWLLIINIPRKKFKIYWLLNNFLNKLQKLIKFFLAHDLNLLIVQIPFKKNSKWNSFVITVLICNKNKMLKIFINKKYNNFIKDLKYTINL